MGYNLSEQEQFILIELLRTDCPDGAYSFSCLSDILPGNDKSMLLMDIERLIQFGLVVQAEQGSIFIKLSEQGREQAESLKGIDPHEAFSKLN